MAYYYVRDNGTFVGTKATTGGDSTPRTGAWDTTAANSFASIEAAITTGGADGGDVIVVADDHNHNYTADATFNSVGAVADALIITSVDNTSQDTPKAGATETQSGSGFYFEFAAHIILHNMRFDAGRGIRGWGKSYLKAYNCTFTNGNTTTGYGMYATNNGSDWKFYNCTFSWTGTSANNYMAVYNRAIMYIYGGSLTCNASTGSLFRNIGGSLFVYGLDMGGSTAGYLLDDTYSSANYGNLTAVFSGCRVPSFSTGFYNGDLDNTGGTLLIQSCGTTSAEAEYQYYYHDRKQGYAETTTGVYRDDSTGYDSGEKVSIKVTTLATCDEFNPFWFPLPSFFATLSSTSTDKLTAYLCTNNVTLYDTDVGFFMSYQDGTNNHIYNWAAAHTVAVQAGTAFGDGTELTTSTKTWKDGSDTAPPSGWTIKKYEVSIDTASGAGGDPGADAMIIPWMHVQKASATLYVCPEFGEGT